MEYGEDTLQSLAGPTNSLSSDPLQVLDPLQAVDFHTNSDMGMFSSRGSGLYRGASAEQTNASQSIFGSSPRTDMDADELSEELEGNTTRQYSIENDFAHNAFMQRQYDPLLPLNPQIRSEERVPHRSQTLKTHSLSHDSGLFTSQDCVESSSQVNSTKAKQSVKKLTHYRSMSDYGLPHKAIVEDANTEDKSSESASLSSSLPVNQRGMFLIKEVCLPHILDPLNFKLKVHVYAYSLDVHYNFVPP